MGLVKAFIHGVPSRKSFRESKEMEGWGSFDF